METACFEKQTKSWGPKNKILQENRVCLTKFKKKLRIVKSEEVVHECQWY